jgi:ATP-binding cassette subfamily B protein/subfamily B ATP-binding cassette protein MsbA
MQAYRRLLSYAAPYWRSWLTIVLVTLLSTAFSLLQPWPLKVLIDSVLGDVAMAPGAANAIAWLPGATTRQGLLVWVVAAGLAFFVAGSIADVVLTVKWTRVGRRMVYDLARDLFARLQRRSLVFHRRHSVGDSISRIAGDSWAVHTVVDTLLFAPGHALFTIVAMVAVMARLDPWLTLLALGVTPFMGGSAWLFGKPIRRAARAKREIESRIQSHVQQTLGGIPLVQAFGREDLEQRRFQDNASAAIRAHQRSALIGSAYGLGSGLITTLGTAAVLWLAARRVLDGRLTVGTTMVFLAYLGTLQAQLAAFSGIYAAMQGAGASIDRVMEVLDSDESVQDRPGAPPLPPVRGHVAIEDAVFGYDDHSILESVTLEARPGETIAIVGHTGAGKSTLVSLIPRFFDVWTGRVLIDGHDVRDVQVRSVRDQVALVLQEPFLFPISVADNIAYARPGASRDEIVAAARAANAHRFIEKLPQGYATVLGEQGATLSGGERQRLSIARAILKDAPILILDEPTSALDAETEHALLEALERLMKGRTTFIIAHRLSTIRRATKIVVLDRGVIVEEGTHEVLLASGGPYSRLHDLQFGTIAGTPAA